MQGEILEILEKNKHKFDYCWVHQTEIITIVQERLKLEFTPLISNGLSKLRHCKDLPFKKITHNNYKRMLKEINREELLQYPSLFKRYTFFYKIK